MGDLGYEGRKLGRYVVVKHLASGGMAQVLLARATGIEGFERYVVIKQIHIERAKDETVVKMFLDEARMSALLHHTNIVQVHDIGQENGEYFFTMEYVHGEDLRKLLNYVNRRDEQVPLEHLLTIVTSSAAALHYAHDLTTTDRKPLNIVHRDVSPANIIVGYDGTVKVVDFGIAKAAFRSTETQSGTLKGKISYMSPEQCMGQQVDRRSDVFALGVVLYELATVRRLFKGPSDFLTMSAIVEGNIPPPSTYRKDLPPQLEEIILRALHPVPDERYQTADELRVDLDRFARKAGLRGSTTDLADYMRQIFGQRPEPWLVEAAELTQEVMDVDFDGSASGAAVVPKREGGRLATGLPTPSPDSPIARVRRKVAPAGGVAIMTESPEPGHAPAARSSIPPASPVAGWDSEDKPTTASGTPMAWTPGAPPLPPVRARRWGIAVGVVGALALGVVAIVRPWSGGSQSSPATPAAATAPPLPSPPAEPAKLAEPPPAEPAKLAEPAPPAEPAKPSATPRPVVVKNPAPKSPKTKPDPRKPRFDPKSLFPE